MNTKGNLANVEVDNSNAVQSKRDSSTSNPSIAPSAESNIDAIKAEKYISVNSRKKLYNLIYGQNQMDLVSTHQKIGHGFIFQLKRKSMRKQMYSSTFDSA